MQEKHCDQSLKRKGSIMKNYKEMTKCILDARDEYDARKRHQQVIIKRCTIALSSACCAVLICFGIFGTWEKINKLPDVEVQPINTIISDNTDTTASNNSKTSSTTVVTSDKNVSATVKTEKSRSDIDNSEGYTEYDSSGEDSVISADDPTVSAETKKPSVTTAVSQAKGKTTTKKTVVSVTKSPVQTTIVTETKPVETPEPEPTTDDQTEKMKIVRFRFYSKIDDMDYDNYRANLAEMYSVLYEILDSDYMSDDGRIEAEKKLAEKEKQMQCLFPRVADIIRGVLSPYERRMTYSLADEIVQNSESYSKLYWSFMIFTPDVIENVGFSGTREYWLDDYGAEKIVFYSTSGNVFYEHYGKTEPICRSTEEE